MIKSPKSKKAKDYNTVVLEELRSDFKVFGEGLNYVRKKGDATFEAVGKLQEDMLEVKTELHIIRNELKEKVGRDEFKLLEHRVNRLEKAFRVRQ